MDALVVLVGITADRTRRHHVRSVCRAKTDFDVLVPALPERLGLQACSVFLRAYLGFVAGPGRHDHVHFLNYISGGFVFRMVARHLDFLKIGRVLYDRAPIQEEVPELLLQRYTRAGVLIARGKTTTDLASGWIHDLPFPSSDLEQGLIIETEPSRLARDLGLSQASPPVSAWRPEHLLPDADAVRRIRISHDDVYESPMFLDEALHFLRTGRFSRNAASDTVGAAGPTAAKR
jgi:hypothetical protein